MPYNPFHVSTDQQNSRDTKLISVRRPAIFDIPLQALEWGVSDHHHHTHRKRARPDSTSQHQASKPDTYKSQQNNEQPHVKEVVRVVEKVVEPITIMGVVPLVDDRVRYVVEFILSHVDSPNIEVEAKLGVLNEREKDVRAVDLVPVLCETPIRPESNKDTRFQSDIGHEMFRRLNTRLNRRIEETAGLEQGRIEYRRTHECDVFWPGRVRETRERRVSEDGTETYETIRVQSKHRLGDLNVLCPGKIADVRYSANSEEDCSLPASTKSDMRRLKDRISYKYEYLSVDITCVETTKASDPDHGTTTFEVEVEIDSSACLYEEVIKFRERDETSKLFDIAASMVNTVRLLLET